MITFNLIILTDSVYPHVTFFLNINYRKICCFFTSGINKDNEYVNYISNVVLVISAQNIIHNSLEEIVLTRVRNYFL